MQASTESRAPQDFSLVMKRELWNQDLYIYSRMYTDMQMITDIHCKRTHSTPGHPQIQTGSDLLVICDLIMSKTCVGFQKLNDSNSERVGVLVTPFYLSAGTVAQAYQNYLSVSMQGQRFQILLLISLSSPLNTKTCIVGKSTWTSRFPKLPLLPIWQNQTFKL